MSHFSSLTVVCFLIGTSSSTLTHIWNACDRSSADFNQCLKDQINNAFHFLKDGSEELRLPRMDPLTLETVVIEEGQGLLPIDLRLGDVTIRGLSKLRVTDVSNEGRSLELRYFLERFQVEGDYSLSANLLVLPLSASGPSSFVYENLTSTISADIREETNGGKKFFQVDNLSVHNEAESFTMNVLGLFSGEKHFDSIMNKFLNKNCKHIVAEAMSKAQAKIFTDMANMVFTGLPVSVQYAHSEL